MFKRSYLVLLMAALLGVGAAAANGYTEDPQKEKEKQKEKAAAASEAVVADPFPLAIQLGGGSYLGVYLEDVTSERAGSLKLKEERGALVVKVAEGSPAEKAGLKENDVIVSFNGRPVESVRELQRLLGETPEGRTVQMEVIREGSHHKLSATISNRSREFWAPGLAERERIFRDSDRAQKELRDSLDRLNKRQRDLGAFDFTGPRALSMYYRGSRLGISVETMGDQLAEYFGVKEGKGALVTEVRENTPAAKAGLKAGDVITAVDGQKINGVDELLRAINRKEEGQLTLTIVRNRSEQSLTLTIEKRQGRAPARRTFTSV